MYYFHLFLISSPSAGSLPFLSFFFFFFVPIFGQNTLLIFPVFLKGSLLPPPLLLFSSTIKHCSLKKPLLSLLAILSILYLIGYMFPFLPWILLLFIISLYVKPLQMNTLPFYFSFSLRWFYLPLPVKYYGPLTIVLQAHCLLDLVFWIYLLPLLWIHMRFDLSLTWLA